MLNGPVEYGTTPVEYGPHSKSWYTAQQFMVPGSVARPRVLIIVTRGSVLRNTCPSTYIWSMALYNVIQIQVKHGLTAR